MPWGYRQGSSFAKIYIFSLLVQFLENCKQNSTTFYLRKLSISWLFYVFRLVDNFIGTTKHVHGPPEQVFDVSFEGHRFNWLSK